MPQYEFKCSRCEIMRTELQKLTDALPHCEKCGKEMERVWAVPIGKPVFKCDGFYETDYKKAVNPSD